MEDSSEINQYVEDPDLLLGLIKDVLRALESISNRDQISTMEVQLREISKAIEKVEKQGFSSPDPWRAEKTRLIAALESQTEHMNKITQLFVGLQEISQDINARILRSSSPNQKSIDAKNTSPRTNKRILRALIIEALQHFGGSATSTQVIEYMNEKLDGKFLPGDLELSGRLVAWKAKTAWEHTYMIKEGILKPVTRTGFWELNED